MSLSDWFRTTFFNRNWAERESQKLSQELAGTWVFVSLSNELDLDLLEAASGSGKFHECRVVFQLDGLTKNQFPQVQAAITEFESGWVNYAEVEGNIEHSWNDAETNLSVELSTATEDPASWFHITHDLIPRFLEQMLDFDFGTLSHSVECHLRPA